MHDRNGTPIGVGDIVTIQAKVVHTGSDDAGGYCNCTLEYGYERPREAFNMRGTISAINTKQTLLVEKALAPVEPVVE